MNHGHKINSAGQKNLGDLINEHRGKILFFMLSFFEFCSLQLTP